MSRAFRLCWRRWPCGVQLLLACRVNANTLDPSGLSIVDLQHVAFRRSVRQLQRLVRPKLALNYRAGRSADTDGVGLGFRATIDDRVTGRQIGEKNMLAYTHVETETLQAPGEGFGNHIHLYSRSFYSRRRMWVEHKRRWGDGIHRTQRHSKMCPERPRAGSGS